VSHRRFGGAGIEIAGPQTIVRITPNRGLSIVGHEHIDERSRIELNQLLKRVSLRRGELEVQIEIVSCAPQHVGLGSKTSLWMALLFALDQFHGWSLGRTELQEMSGRGGTSGIGIHSFFHGGLVVDGGHVPGGPYRPSSASLEHDLPPLIVNLPVPTNWHFAILLPTGEQISGTDEEGFFDNNTPLPSLDSLKAIAAIHHGVIPAFALKDLRLLRSALIELHRCGFKRIELGSQSSEVRLAYEALAAREDVAVGLSSLGPVLYVVYDEEPVPLDKIAGGKSRVLGTWAARNTGPTIVATK
jgi:beta-ribofuranosylaminobenzene 5'-phosphate synthase